MGIPRLVKLRIIYQKFYFRRFISALFPVSKFQIMMNLKTCILLVAAILIISLGTEAESKPNCVCVHSPCECDYGEVLRERSEKAKSQVRQAGPPRPWILGQSEETAAEKTNEEALKDQSDSSNNMAHYGERSEKAKSQVRQAKCVCVTNPCPCAKPSGGGLLRERFEAAKSAKKRFAEGLSPPRPMILG